MCVCSTRAFHITPFFLEATLIRIISFFSCQSGAEFVNFHSAPNNRNRFSVQAIRFLQNSTAVFFHCRFYLCYTSSTDQKCNLGCGYNRKNKNSNRRKRSVEEQSPSPSDYYLLDMEVRLKEESQCKYYKHSLICYCTM